MLILKFKFIAHICSKKISFDIYRNIYQTVWSFHFSFLSSLRKSLKYYFENPTFWSNPLGILVQKSYLYFCLYKDIIANIPFHIGWKRLRPLLLRCSKLHVKTQNVYTFPDNGRYSLKMTLYQSINQSVSQSNDFKKKFTATDF